MLRTVLLWASTNPFLSRTLPRMGFVRRATRRFMPGEHLEDALAAAAGLQEEGLASTFTLLGEHITRAEEADAVAEHYLEVLGQIRRQGLDGEISVKPSQLGIDLGADEGRQRLERILEAAPSDGIVWVDMESSAYVDATLDIFRGVRERFENVGLCLQSYLRRTPADLDALLPLRPAIRLVKGAYREPREIAFPKKRDVDRAFVDLARTLLQARKEGRVGRPQIATHDPAMIRAASEIAREIELPREAYEFSLLYGIQTAEQRRLAREGHLTRILISYGEHWFPWYMRRLAERPANVWFVLRQVVAR